MSREAMKLALEKFAKVKKLCDKHGSKINRKHIYGGALVEHFDVVCQALAEQPAQQEPVAWIDDDGNLHREKPHQSYGPEPRPLVYGDTSPQPAQPDRVRELECVIADLKAECQALRAEQPAPVQQEPVRGWWAHTSPVTGITDVQDWQLTESDKASGWVECEIYTSPPAQRKPLTDEEIDFIWGAAITPSNHIRVFVRAIEDAHGIKENT